MGLQFSAWYFCPFLKAGVTFAVRQSSGEGGITGPDSLVVRASASGAVGRGFAPRPGHTKGGKNGTGSSLADARNKMWSRLAQC